jgi:hypothetical protein
LKPKELTAQLIEDASEALRYKVADCCSLAIGGSFFLGIDDYTFLNQLQNNSNAYAALQYGF